MPKNKTTTEALPVKAVKSSLISPRLTEKSAILSESRGVYAFNVERDATKRSIIASVKAEYKVTPESVRMVAVPGQNVIFKGHRGKRSAGKKAYVYLKKGDKIDFA
ncbi:50S ribosomal protein L23 [Candidatus Parcubacteria bacterium]|nr:50S ribosomal protein L23 [Candidatus Parcubacteria bacterium]